MNRSALNLIFPNGKTEKSSTCAFGSSKKTASTAKHGTAIVRHPWSSYGTTCASSLDLLTRSINEVPSSKRRDLFRDAFSGLAAEFCDRIVWLDFVCSLVDGSTGLLHPEVI